MLLYQYNQLTEFLFSLKLVIKFSLRWVTRCRSDVRFISPLLTCLSPLQEWQLICVRARVRACVRACVRNGKSAHVTYLQNKSKWWWTWSGGWEWWAVSGVNGRWSWFYLHIYATKYFYFWIFQRRLARHWGGGVIHDVGTWNKFPE